MNAPDKLKLAKLEQSISKCLSVINDKSVPADAELKQQAKALADDYALKITDIVCGEYRRVQGE